MSDAKQSDRSTRFKALYDVISAKTNCEVEGEGFKSLFTEKKFPDISYADFETLVSKFAQCWDENGENFNGDEGWLAIEANAIQLTKDEGRLQWRALESNPDVLNSFCDKLGVGSDYGFSDIFGLDPELLMMVPQPCRGVILLRPSGLNKIERAAQENKDNVSPEFYMTQLACLGNACGTIAMLHCLLNSDNLHGGLTDSKNLIAEFSAACKDKTPLERGEYLAQNEAIQQLHNGHQAQGQTESPDTAEGQSNVNAHFIAFVHQGGLLWELDGCKDGPINHGATSQETFLTDTAASIRKYFMDPNPSELGFSMMAFGPKPQW